MNVAENFMLRQMQQMAANMSSVPKTGNGGGKKDQTSSFQDMMDQTGQDTKVDASDSTGSDNGQTQKDPVQNTENAEKPAVKTEKDQEAGKVQEMHGDPNAMAAVMDLFRPEIVDVPEEGTLAAAPVEAVGQETAAPVEMISEEVMPEVQVDAGPIQVENVQVVQEAPQETVVEQAPEAVQQTEAPVETAEAVEAAPEQAEVVEEAKPEEVQVTQRSETEETAEPQEGAAEVTQHVFHEVDTTPVKVGESYRTLDTEEPHMEEKLADTVREAVEAGAERVEIQLSPANLGRITIEMTRSASGVLEVVLHAANTKAAGLLGQHLDGLHAALQSYSQESVHVEVQRTQENQEQHLFQHADPDGRGRQQGREEQRQHQQENEEHDSGDFLQKLRLGLVSLETI